MDKKPPKPNTTIMSERDICAERTVAILIFGLGFSFCVPMLVYVISELL